MLDVKIAVEGILSHHLQSIYHSLNVAIPLTSSQPRNVALAELVERSLWFGVQRIIFQVSYLDDVSQGFRLRKILHVTSPFTKM